LQLYDKDLLSVQEVRSLLSAAKAAQQELATKSQEYVDRIVKAIADAGVRNAVRLGALAQEETGFGRAEHKTIKNIFASKFVWEYIKDMKTVGEIGRDESKGLTCYAVPLGVIAGIVPSTNPTSTCFYKAEISIKAGNAIVFSPHPSAQHCIDEAVKVIRQAIAEAGGNENLVSTISIPTRQATNILMSHPDTAMILATGGSAMVRAAYSSGTPAIGVGPGNGPSYIEATADIPLAVKRIVDSKTFDNGTICASEQSVITNDDMVSAVQAEMKRQGFYFLTDEQRDKLSKFILRGNGTMNPQIVGKDPQTVANLAGITIPADTRVIVAVDQGIGRGHPYSNEKLSTILGFFHAENYVKVCEHCVDLLHYEGAGHTFSIHTKDKDIIKYFAERIPASRIVVNSPSTFGGIGASTGLMPALTLGCGAIGGSATSENVGPLQLIDRRYVACGQMELEDIQAAVSKATGSCACAAPAAPSCCGGAAMSEADIDAIVKKILERLSA